MSGQYNPNPKKPGLFDRAYYGPDTENYAKRAAINHIEGLRVPVFIVYAELDPPDIEAQNVDLYEALCKKHNAPLRLAVLKGHNHLSEVLHLNTEEDSFGPDLLDFIRTGR